MLRGIDPDYWSSYGLLTLGAGGTRALGAAGGGAIRVLLAAMVVAVPATLMGGTLPAAARAVEAERGIGGEGRWQCPESMPPQSTLSVEVAAVQVPVQPVRARVPSVIAAPEKDPSLPREAR